MQISLQEYLKISRVDLEKQTLFDYIPTYDNHEKTECYNFFAGFENKIRGSCKDACAFPLNLLNPSKTKVI